MVVLVFKVLHGMVPSYLSDLIHIKSKSRFLGSNAKFLLLVDIPTASLKSAGRRAFSYTGPVLFNVLLEDRITVGNLLVFKGKLKTYLFSQDFGHIIYDC